MNPVIGLDIAKGESQSQAFLNKGKPYGKSFTIIHTQAFTDFRGVYGALYSAASLQTLLAFPTSKDVLSTVESKLTEKQRRSQRVI